QGDTLTAIAARFSVPEATLLSLNRLSDRNLIFPGQTLSLSGTVPAPQEDAAPAAPVSVPADAPVPEAPVRAPILVAGTGPLPEFLVDGAADDLASQDAFDDGAGDDELPQLARLSVDSGGTALAV